MSFPSRSSPTKRPRLSLQTKAHATALTYGKSSTASKANVDPSSPTAFNTLSNAYAIAIENASPKTARPLSGDGGGMKPTSLRLETKSFGNDGYIHPSQRTQTPGPFSITYPDTPSSALPSSAVPGSTPIGPSEPQPQATSFTFTPPQSAGTTDPQPRVFTFTSSVPNKDSSTPTRTPRRRATFGQFQTAPYTHPRSLHSILRNSPLPPRSTVTPITPSRVSLRIANRANKKVGYNNPLTQTITTNKYIKSHIDLLSEDTPVSAGDGEQQDILETTLAYTGDETRDGGETPGPFEEMRRRMAESGLVTPETRKRKRKEKKRKWEWTIPGTEAAGGGEEEDGEYETTPAPLTAVRLEKTPNTAACRESSVTDTDSEMSEIEEGRFVGSCIDPTDSEMSSSDDQRPGSSQSV